MQMRNYKDIASEKKQQSHVYAFYVVNLSNDKFNFNNKFIH